MKRRDFLALTSAALTLLPAIGRAEAANYTPGMVDDLLAEGRTVFVGFNADWCTTCAAQERVMARLKAENPAYAQSIAFVNVNWDEYGRGELATRLNIPRRSTLVVLKGDEELGRIVAGTSEGDIKALMDTALGAATS